MTNQHPADRAALGDRTSGEQDCGDARSASGENPCASYDYIDETIEESMDASDAPSFTPQTSVGPPSHGTDAQPARRD